MTKDQYQSLARVIDAHISAVIAKVAVNQYLAERKKKADEAGRI